MSTSLARLATVVSFLVAAAVPPASGAGSGGAARPRFVATIPPMADILARLAGPRAEVAFLLPAGASPHTYEPRPSDVRSAETATALFYVDARLDGWASRIPGPEKIRILSLVPDSLLHDFPREAESEKEEGRGAGDQDSGDHGAGLDPHFWTDPLAVRAIVPLLAERLAALDPAGADAYRTNALRLEADLDSLHHEIERIIAPARGRSVVLSHPVICYFLRRYGVPLAWVIEWVEGKEPTAKDVALAIRHASEERATAVFAPPELSRRAAELVAESARLRVRLVDPLGGVAGLETYDDLLRAIAKEIAEGAR